MKLTSDSGEQAVSGRWRALARGQLKLETNIWPAELTAGLRAILMAASWEVTAEDEVRSFEAKVEAIFKAVLDVRTAIGEKVTSADMEVNVVRPGSPFIKAMMEDAYSSNKPEARFESVIATTGIGLWRVAPANGPTVYTIVLSPKIVLDSTLKSLLDPPPPPVAKSKLNRARKPDDDPLPPVARSKLNRTRKSDDDPPPPPVAVPRRASRMRSSKDSANQVP